MTVAPSFRFGGAARSGVSMSGVWARALADAASRSIRATAIRDICTSGSECSVDHYTPSNRSTHDARRYNPGIMRQRFAFGFFICALAVSSLSGPGHAQQPAAVNRVEAGAFIVEHPTLINLGFEWMIAGDDNRNASVAVRYRKA